MKKLTFILTVLSALSLKAEAQKGYVRIGGGYGAAAAGQSRDIDGTPLNGNASYNTKQGFTDMDLKKASYGAGAFVNAALGSMINEHVGLELNASVGIGPAKYTTHLNYSDAANKYSYAMTTVQQAKLPILLTPSLVLQTGKKVHLYMRAGVILPVSTRLKSTMTVTQVQNGVTSSGKGSSQTYFSFKPGFACAAGLDFKIAKVVKFYVEANSTSLSLYVNEQASVAPIKANYFYSFKADGSSRYGRYSYPYSSIGGSVGLRFDFK
ncbi:MAG: hypothetical protein BGO70_00630 [Bacteroidetes bacterium 43-93]|jgi:hypothetical protein|nr:hypothetical protein [Bacteroidota bacterium]OJW96224.1 MAG: hypothetical protein BGO70_00630 [Bacteroidetes bacterium 43-93]